MFLSPCIIIQLLVKYHTKFFLLFLIAKSNKFVLYIPAKHFCRLPVI